MSVYRVDRKAAVPGQNDGEWPIASFRCAAEFGRYHCGDQLVAVVVNAGVCEQGISHGRADGFEIDAAWVGIASRAAVDGLVAGPVQRDLLTYRPPRRGEVRTASRCSGVLPLMLRSISKSRTTARTTGATATLRGRKRATSGLMQRSVIRYSTAVIFVRERPASH
jgi:hypothetical protein